MLNDRAQGQENTVNNPQDDVHYEEVVCDCEECTQGTQSHCQGSSAKRPESAYIYEYGDIPNAPN